MAWLYGTALVLVIADDPATLECIRVLCEKTHGTMTTADTAPKGLHLFTHKRPEVVIVDLHPQDKSGIEMLRRLHDLDPKVPVILIANQCATETAVEAIRIGAYDYIVKPLDPEPLRQLIQGAVEMSRLMEVPGKVADANQGTAPTTFWWVNA